MMRAVLPLFLVVAGGGCSNATGLSGGEDSGVAADGGSDAGTDTGADSAADADAYLPSDGPVKHRPTAVPCDGVRGTPDPSTLPSPDAGGGYHDCYAHEDCTDGVNGRCVGARMGYVCTYDQCQTDDDCGEGVCECGGGQMGHTTSDYDVCVARGNCRVNADCGDSGYCSPTFGSCGAYSGVVAYYCHTPNDECVNDADCGTGEPWGSYCAYNEIGGRWICSNSHCAG